MLGDTPEDKVTVKGVVIHTAGDTADLGAAADQMSEDRKAADHTSGHRTTGKADHSHTEESE